LYHFFTICDTSYWSRIVVVWLVATALSELYEQTCPLDI
jgi:hypothetical protein